MVRGEHGGARLLRLARTRLTLQEADSQVGDHQLVLGGRAERIHLVRGRQRSVDHLEIGVKVTLTNPTASRGNMNHFPLHGLPKQWKKKGIWLAHQAPRCCAWKNSCNVNMDQRFYFCTIELVEIGHCLLHTSLTQQHTAEKTFGRFYSQKWVNKRCCCWFNFSIPSISYICSSSASPLAHCCGRRVDSRLIIEALLHFQTTFRGFVRSATKTLIMKGEGLSHAAIMRSVKVIYSFRHLSRTSPCDQRYSGT